MKLGEEIFSVLKGFGYLIELYDATGRGPISSPELAEYVYAKDKASDDSVMIRLPKEDTNEYKKVVVYKSHSMDEKFKKLLMTIKNIALKHNGTTVTFRQFGRNIEPKDLAYHAKSEQELENSSMNEDVVPLKQKKSTEEKFKKAWEKQNDNKHRYGVGSEPCKYCGELSCDFDCDGSQGDIDDLDEDVVPFKKKEQPRIKKMDPTKIRDKVKGFEQHGKLIQNVSGVPTARQDVVDEGDDKMEDHKEENKNHSEREKNISFIMKKRKEMRDKYHLDDKKEPVAEAAKYQRYGTTRSSYHVMPESKKARVIIRHSKKLVDENSVGARSRNVKNLYVESVNGERRLIETKSLMCARAIANHINYGGNLFDDTSNKILQLSEDIKKIKKLKRKYPVSEDASNKKIHESLNNVSEGLLDFMKCLNTSKISTLVEALNLSQPNVAFAEAFYSEKLGEGYEISPLARGSVLYTKTRKFLPR